MVRLENQFLHGVRDVVLRPVGRVDARLFRGGQFLVFRVAQSLGRAAQYLYLATARLGVNDGA